MYKLKIVFIIYYLCLDFLIKSQWYNFIWSLIFELHAKHLSQLLHLMHQSTEKNNMELFYTLKLYVQSVGARAYCQHTSVSHYIYHRTHLSLIITDHTYILWYCLCDRFFKQPEPVEIVVKLFKSINSSRLTQVFIMDSQTIYLLTYYYYYYYLPRPLFLPPPLLLAGW